MRPGSPGQGSKWANRKKTEAIPSFEQFLPPAEVNPAQILVKANGVIIMAKGTKQVDHSAKKCPTLWGDLAGMMEVADQGFQPATFTKNILQTTHLTV